MPLVVAENLLKLGISLEIQRNAVLIRTTILVFFCDPLKFHLIFQAVGWLKQKIFAINCSRKQEAFL